MELATRAKLIGSMAVQSAIEGDPKPLIKLISEGEEQSDEVRDYLISLVKGERLRPAHRPAKQATQRRHFEIALHVRERERHGCKQHAAVLDAADAFGCSERTVRTACSNNDKHELDQHITCTERLVRFVEEFTSSEGAIARALIAQNEQISFARKMLAAASEQQKSISSVRNEALALSRSLSAISHQAAQMNQIPKSPIAFVTQQNQLREILKKVSSARRFRINTHCN